MSDMSGLDPLSTQLPLATHTTLLYDVLHPSKLIQEHALLAAYPALRDSLEAVAKTVAPDVWEALKKLHSNSFQTFTSTSGSSGSHLDFFWRMAPANAKPWNKSTLVRQLHPSIAGTPLAEECTTVLSKAMGKAETHLQDMESILIPSQPGAAERTNEVVEETDDLGDPEIYAEFRFPRDIFVDMHTIQTVLQFNAIFDSKCNPFVPGCTYASFGTMFQYAIFLGDTPARSPQWLINLMNSQTGPSECTTSQTDFDEVRSRSIVLSPTTMPTVTTPSTDATISGETARTGQPWDSILSRTTVPSSPRSHSAIPSQLSPKSTDGLQEKMSSAGEGCRN